MTTVLFRSRARSTRSSSRCGLLLALSLLCGTGRSWTTTTSTIVRPWSSSSFSLRASGGGGGGDEFVAAVRSALREKTFVSLSLKGPVAKKRKRRRGDDDAANAAVDVANDRLRGAVRAATGRRVRVKKGERLQVVVRFHGATDVAKNWRWSNDDANDDEVSRGLRDLLSGVLVARLAERDRVDWFRGDENGNEDGRRGRSGVRSGELRTTEGRWTLQRTSARRGDDDDDDHVCSFAPSRDAAVAVAAEEHDRARRVPLSPRSAFLRRLGLTDESGAPRRGAASKLRQCQKFVDVVGGLVERSSLVVVDDDDDDTSSRTTGERRTIRTVDMGCGRAYLTFSLHAWLTERFGDGNVDVRTVGVDARPKLVAEVEGIARDLDDDGFSGLSFVEGTIDGATSSSSRLFRDDDDDDADASANVLVALHACDTATDDALWYGVRAGAEIVVAAPCCHREARRRMERRDRRRNNDDDDDDHVLRDVLRHNVYRERTAETVTDAARALLLEVAGYDVRVFEFVGGEHTAKNVMIAAVKRRRRRERTETERNDLIERARRLTQTFGIDRLALADHMGVSLSPRDETATTTTTTTTAADAVAGDIPVLPAPRRRRAKTRVDA